MNNFLRAALLLGILTGVAVPAAVAQTQWCPPGAQWTYRTLGMIGQGELHVRYTGDTVVAGRTCQLLHQHYRWTNNSATIDNQLLTAATTDRVEVYRNNQFYTLYDFAAGPGASWITISYNQDQCQLTPRVVVDSVGQAFYAGRLRRWFVAHLDPTTVPAGTPIMGIGRVYEGIGAHLSMLVQESRCWNTDGMQIFGITCYRTAAGPLLGCATVTAATAAAVTQAAVFPNPSTGPVQLRLQGAGQAIGTLYDLSGRRTFRTDVSSGQADFTGQPAGVYMLTVEQIGAPVWHQRVVIK